MLCLKKLFAERDARRKSLESVKVLTEINIKLFVKERGVESGSFFLPYGRPRCGDVAKARNVAKKKSALFDGSDAERLRKTCGNLLETIAISLKME